MEKAQQARRAQQEAKQAERANRDEQEVAEQQQRNYERLISTKQASLPAEAPAEHSDTVSIMVRLPNGTRASRRCPAPCCCLISPRGWLRRDADGYLLPVALCWSRGCIVTWLLSCMPATWSCGAMMLETWEAGEPMAAIVEGLQAEPQEHCCSAVVTAAYILQVCPESEPGDFV